MLKKYNIKHARPDTPVSGIPTHLAAQMRLEWVDLSYRMSARLSMYTTHRWRVYVSQTIKSLDFESVVEMVNLIDLS